MGDSQQQVDKPVVPTIRTVKDESAANGPSATEDPTPKGTDLLPPASITRSEPQDTNVSTTEARDYWNGGQPHIHSYTPGVNGGPANGPGRLPVPEPPASERLLSDRTNSDITDAAGTELPSRPSVQFARPDAQESPSQTRRGSLTGTETPPRGKGASSFMSKIKAMAGGSSQNAKTPDAGPGAVDPISLPLPTSPAVSRPPQQRAESLAEGTYDADADAEETADEQNVSAPEQAKKKRARRMRRYRRGERSQPSTPRRTTQEPETPTMANRFLRRRASMPDTSIRNSSMLDEDARSRAAPSGWRTPWHQGTLRAPGDEPENGESSAAFGRRRGHSRRSTVLGGGGGLSDGDAMTPRRPFFGSQASTYGAHKWKQVKNTLKLLRQKKEDRVDYYKSAELMAELRAGAPAVLMLASMIQRDEHGNKRIPVLLEQLKVRIKDSTPDPDDESERHWIFIIELEYGSGPSRMSWTVTRTIRDILNLHFRYRFALRNEKYMPGRLDLGLRLRQPKFPYSAFPYLRGARKQRGSSESDEGASVRGEDTAGEGNIDEGLEDEVPPGILSDAEGSHVPTRKKSRVNLLGMRRRSTNMTDPGELSNFEGANPSIDQATRRQRYIDKQRRILEKYLSEMIRWLMFRADSNRLCRFLELSALGVRLAAEGSYHGKEGYLHIQSSKGLDFRRVLTPAKVISRHSRKWFLVRQSYIVCVDSPENMNIYDVYLVDSKFSIVSKRSALKQIGSKGKKTEIDLTVEAPPEKHHTLTLQTSERQVRLFSGNQAVMWQFEESINEMLRQTAWYEPKRFDSFAPVRQGVFAQWLVDGRDYMWNVSRAINMAKDVIYIHDWWLSPELYMRRPACISQKWRLDRLLQKKAREGVKIFVIIYRNVEAAIPIDSEYTKSSLLNLHPNIFVQRSPNQFKKNQFFFAHHEKICVVDHDVAFVGGIDLCFGRWDSPQHPIADDKPTGFEPSEIPKDAEHCQLFPGKDYSNPRVQDFFKLHEPYEEMYDRSRVPRMPWHDISMQVVGQPARDLTRHFVQRWNYLRRGRRPTRPLPFLLPPPDAKFEELEALGLTGTCEVQILRSASNWSLGTDEPEQSIHTAYIKMIEDSEHFVYMENQFFITSTEVYGTRILNRIGEALVNRIIKAHENDEEWRCVIIIPLMPGFQNTVDEQEGTSVRMILMCQYRSICRGEQSIFGRLRAAGIDPEEYINFYSLRQWGLIGNDVLVTEQLYIHAKAIIVDDRVALIGSANINERSMLGSRDSECAAIVRDTDMIWSTMGGKPYRVGRFAHTLRLRLMREHLGLDVDEILEQERQQELDREDFEQQMNEIYQEDVEASAGPSSHLATQSSAPVRLPSFNHDLDLERAEATHETTSSSSSASSQDAVSTHDNQIDVRVTADTHQLDVSGFGPDHWKAAEKSGLDEGRDSVIINGREVLVHSINNEGKGTLESPKPASHPGPLPDNKHLDPIELSSEALPPVPPLNRRTTEQLDLPRAAQLPSLPVVDDTDIGGPPIHINSSGQPVNGVFHPMAADIKLAHIDKDCMRDPLNDDFMENVWHRAAVNNTKLYRRVFRCMPDSEVSTWAEYQEYVTYGRKFRESMEGRPKSEERDAKSDDHQAQGTAAGAAVSAPGPDAIVKAAEHEVEKTGEKMLEKLHFTSTEDKTTTTIQVPVGQSAELDEKKVGEPSKAEQAASPVVPFPAMESPQAKFLEPHQTSDKRRERRTTFSTQDKPSLKETSSHSPGQVGSVRRRRRANTRGSRRGFTIEDMPSRADAQELMRMTQGHLVQFPYDWLLTEEHNGNWGYQVDGVAPLAIYN